MRSKYLFVFICLAMATLPAMLFGQATGVGTVTGEVLDQTGAALPGVSVELKSQERGTTRMATTDRNGRFLFAQVPLGIHSVSASLSGFQSVTISNNLVESQKNTRVDINMRLAAETTTITVTGDVPIVDRTTTAATTRLSNKEFEKMPVGRSYQALFGAAPGVVGTGNANVHGALSGNNLFMFDGADVTDPTTGTFASNLNFEAIQEVNIYTAGVSAEYGRATGGVINVITKSGTNEFEGSAKYIATNDEWNEQNTTRNQVSGASLERVKFDHINPSLAATLGGPIMRDQAWFFGSYELAETTSALRQTVIVPEEFQETLESPFFTVRGTAQISSNHNVFARYHESPTNGFMIDYFSGSRTPLVAAELEAMTRQDQTAETIMGQWTGIFSPKWSGEAMYAENKETITVFPFEVSPLHGGAPHFNLANGIWYNGATFDGFVSRPREQAFAAVSYFGNWGDNSHNIKFGADWQSLHSGAQFAYPNNQLFIDTSFDPATRTFGPQNRRDYDPPADSTSNGEITSLYVRDKFEVGQRIFLELGARYEQQEGSSDIGEGSVDTSSISPRFAGSYDISGTGKTLIVATGARLYQFILQGFSDAFAAVPQQGNYDNFVWDGSAFVFSNRVTTGRGAIRPNLDLDATYLDELTLGFQQQIGNTVGVGIRGVWREWGDLIDDIRGFNPDGTQFRQVVNYDAAERDYKGVELTFEKRFSSNWNLLANYTFSESRGNHFDNSFSSLGDFTDLQCRTTVDTGIGNNGVVPCLEVQNGASKSGRSTFDRPHHLKLSGAYARPIGPLNLTLGVGGEYISGPTFTKSRAVNVLLPGTTTNSGLTATYFYEERGSDRLDPLYNLDTAIELTWRFFQNFEFGVKGEVFNITDQQEQNQIVNTTWCSESVTSAACNTARDIYGTATARGNFQGPRNFRLTALIRF